MHHFRIGEAAKLLAVSPDTVRRWADAGRLATSRTSGGHRTIAGPDLALLSQELAAEAATEEAGGSVLS
ncbi:MAG: MerR family DNA-binding transcriptional regulator, partial [Acidimicrobiaceae bacterium]|nr:MerR family DNA-binding transcriptional regulator [Acidimicrobiaceae bacterium]